MPFQNVPDIVTASLCLYSLCILENDDFDMDWTRSAGEELQREANMVLNRMHKRDRFMLLESSLKEMKELQNQHSRQHSLNPKRKKKWTIKSILKKVKQTNKDKRK